MNKNAQNVNSPRNQKLPDNFLQAKSKLQESKQLLKRLSELKSHIVSKDPPSITKIVSSTVLSNKKNVLNQRTQASSAKLDNLSTREEISLSKQNIGQKSKIEKIRSNIIGLATQYTSPFNINLQSVYVDHTATNRPYIPIQETINYTKRFVANPHTQFSYFGKYSTEMMHYAHNSLLKSFSADAEKYIIIPTGSGSTGAVEKALNILESFKKPLNQPSVYLTPYQHHSNILPWVQFYEKVNLLQIDQRGTLDMSKIEKQLVSCQSNDIILTVSAASNVTSQVTDLKSLNSIVKRLKKRKNIIFLADFAAYCCHHQLNVKILDQIDFAFFSPHKNLGGSESCGLLMVKKHLMSSKPSFPGGGTVAFVKGYQKEDIIYDIDVFNRQVAGTPPFIGFYRAALSFELLKNDIGYDFIHKRQTQNFQHFVRLIMEQNQRFVEEGLPTSILIYGNCDMKTRANVATFNIFNENQITQHSFVSLILTDAFGIQLRSGCFCAGPFAMQLMKLDKKQADSLTPIFSLGFTRDKPGYVRLDLTFTLQDYQVEYIAKAISATARYIKNMLLVYTICNDGEIKRHKLFKQSTFSMFGLKNHTKAEQTTSQWQKQDQNRLRNRKDTLSKQLQQGLKILKDPLNFLKSQFRNQK